MLKRGTIRKIAADWNRGKEAIRFGWVHLLPNNPVFGVPIINKKTSTTKENKEKNSSVNL